MLTWLNLKKLFIAVNNKSRQAEKLMNIYIIYIIQNINEWYDI